MNRPKAVKALSVLNLWLCECGHIIRTTPLPEHTRQICSQCLTELRAQTYANVSLD